MYLGTQYEPGTPSSDYYQHLKQLGCDHICSTPQGHPATWTTESLRAHRASIENHDLILDMIPLGHIGIGPADPWRAIMLGTPERDRALDSVCDTIRHTAEAGIPAMQYYLHYLGIVSTGHVPGRGGSQNRTFVYADAAQEPLLEVGRIDAETMWERITYFLERVIPVAEASKVRMACHPCDPFLPAGYKGVDRVLGGFDGFRHFIDICPSDYHGLNLCLGCMAESVKNPREEVPNIIRYFGERRKIHLIHFRNIIGGQHKFQEVYPDEGDMDMFALAEALRDVGYPHMMVPDHAPQHDAPGHFEQAFAYQFGFIKSTIQAVNR